MNPVRLPDGRIQIPIRLDGPDGEIGEARTVIGPDDPRCTVWDDWLLLLEDGPAAQGSP